jgi:hypothetical protein
MSLSKEFIEVSQIFAQREGRVSRLEAELKAAMMELNQAHYFLRRFGECDQKGSKPSDIMLEWLELNRVGSSCRKA